MQQDHAAVERLGQHPPGNLLRVAQRVVLRVDVLPQGDVTQGRRARDDLRVRGLVERLVGVVGRPEEPRVPPGDPLEQLLGDVQLHLHAERRHAREVRVREGVVADRVPFGELAADQVGVRLCVAADDEEGRVHAALREQVEDARRPDGVGPVVEGERHSSAGFASLAFQDPP